MKMFIKVLISGIALTISLGAYAKDIEEPEIYMTDNELKRVSVKWIDPSSFRDIRPANQSRLKYRNHVFTNIEEHFDKLAEDLPEGQTLEVSVTNVDLAGRVEPGRFLGLTNNLNDVRVMTNIDVPRISFEYAILDSNGNKIKSEEVELKDMSYLMHGTRSFSARDAFGYEKRMITKWFKSDLLVQA